MRFIANRIVVTFITLFLVSIITFAAFHIIPGDAALLSLGIEASEEQIAALREEWGLDKSLPEQYFTWLRNFATGNLGNSTRFMGASITGLIRERLPVTISLALISLFFILVITIPVSLLPMKKTPTLFDSFINSLTAVNISIPGFFLGVLFIWFFGLILRLFIPGAYVDYRIDILAFLLYLILPGLAISLPNAAILIKFLRTSIRREWSSDYVRTALSKGANRKRTLNKHIIKNACMPGLTMLGMIIGEIFTGSIVMEQVFSIPGIGRLLITSITSRDYLMAETLIAYIAFVVIIANTLVDIAIQMIDPRIRLGANAAEGSKS